MPTCRRTVWWMRATLALALTTVLLGACTGGTPKPAPTVTLTPSITDVKVFTGLGHEHLVHKKDYPHRYDQVPPAGGPHAPRWLRCDAYGAAVPNEFAVHSLEHGGIWITYQPTLAAASVQKLALLQPTNQEYVLVSPFEGLPSPVVVTAWGLQLQVQTADDPRIVEFIKTYAGGGQGGEPGYPCRTGGLTPDQVPAFIASLP
jgi:hypothetical protein